MLDPLLDLKALNRTIEKSRFSAHFKVTERQHLILISCAVVFNKNFMFKILQAF